MKTINKSSQANDYAVAKALNDQVKGILSVIFAGYGLDMAKDKDIEGLNRAYILLIHELEAIYSRYQELQELKPKPIWKRFDMLKGSSDTITDYIIDTDDFGYRHNLRVEKLCIITGIDNPEYTTNQQDLINYTETVVSDYVNRIKIAFADNEISTNVEYISEIFEYSLKYKQDGTILINQVLKLKKVHAGSITEKLLEQSIKNPDTKFKPDLGKTSRNLSTIISSAGFTPVLRELFFPTVSGDTVVFRPYVSKSQADLERIDRTELDIKLKENGALCRVVAEPK